MEDHELYKEIQRHVEILNHYISIATKHNKLKVDVKINEYRIFPYQHLLPIIDCKIYKEVL